MTKSDTVLLQRLKFDSKPELKLNSLQKEAKDEIQSKIESGEYMLERVHCPICGDNKSEVIGEKDRYGLQYKTNICCTCGLVYTNPRMDEASYQNFYDCEYRKLYVGTEKPTSEFFTAQIRKGKSIYDFLNGKKLLPEKKLTVLEIGCGAGGILHFFRSKGHEVMGIDLGTEYINYGRNNHDLNLRVGTLSNINITENPDIIIYSHVMEHILDLEQELNLINTIAHKETILYVEVPGIKNIHRSYRSNILRYFQNAHTFHFSLESLNNIMNKNGFQLITGNQNVQSAYKIGDSKHTFMNDYHDVKTYIINTEKNRKRYYLSKAGIKEFLTQVIIRVLDFTRMRKLIKKLKAST